MRILPLLLPLTLALTLALTATSLWSADYLRLTLSDGKILIGYFDEKKGTLTLDDGSTIAIKAEAIIRRDPEIPREKPLNIPPPVKPPVEDLTPPKAKEVPARRNELMTMILIKSLEDVHQARRRWIEVQRKISGQSSALPAELAQQRAAAQADLDEATAIARQINVALQAQLMARTTAP